MNRKTNVKYISCTNDIIIFEITLSYTQDCIFFGEQIYDQKLFFCTTNMKKAYQNLLNLEDGINGQYNKLSNYTSKKIEHIKNLYNDFLENFGYEISYMNADTDSIVLSHKLKNNYCKCNDSRQCMVNVKCDMYSLFKLIDPMLYNIAQEQKKEQEQEQEQEQEH